MDFRYLVEPNRTHIVFNIKNSHLFNIYLTLKKKKNTSGFSFTKSVAYNCHIYCNNYYHSYNNCAHPSTNHVHRDHRLSWTISLVGSAFPTPLNSSETNAELKVLIHSRNDVRKSPSCQCIYLVCITAPLTRVTHTHTPWPLNFIIKRHW
jgi:hypothetical protein